MRLPALSDIRLRGVGSLAALFVVVCSVSPSESADPSAAVNVPVGSEWGEERPIAGAYYYPWYHDTEGPESWERVFRWKLAPPQTPRIGLYHSDDPLVVREHISQSVRAGLSFWAVSWWGPHSPTDRNTLDVILDHPDASRLRYAMLYESRGRFGDPDEPDFSNWESDLAYLREHYFSHKNYLRVNGKPVLFVYLTRVFFREHKDELLRIAHQGPDPVYLVADDVFGEGYGPDRARGFDAVTAYDIYGQSAGVHGNSRKAVDQLASNYRTALEAANDAGVAFVPAVSPGYNDTPVRPGHPGMPRHFADEGNAAEGEVFQAMLDEAAFPNVDPSCGRLMMVTSFNEWYEDTQIEATGGTQPTATTDQTPSTRAYTAGEEYEDYGDRYLDLLNQALETKQGRGN